MSNVLNDRIKNIENLISNPDSFFTTDRTKEDVLQFLLKTIKEDSFAFKDTADIIYILACVLALDHHYNRDKKYIDKVRNVLKSFISSDSPASTEKDRVLFDQKQYDPAKSDAVKLIKEETTWIRNKSFLAEDLQPDDYKYYMNGSENEGAGFLLESQKQGTIVFTAIKRLIKKQGFDEAEIMQKEKIIHIPKKTAGGIIDLFIQCEVARRQVIISAVTPLRIGPQIRKDFLEDLNGHNEELFFGFFFVDKEGCVIYRSTFFYISKAFLKEEILGMHVMGAIHEAEKLLVVLEQNR